MSIIGFHRFLISVAILFCGAFAGWTFVRYAGGAGTGAAVLGAVFTLLTVGLAYYLKNLARFLARRSG